MKRKNAVSDFASQRNEILLNNFRSKLAANSSETIMKIFKKTADSPAPRFWVSEERAAVVIGAMLRGDDPTPEMFPEKRDMFREIFARFSKMRASNPDLPIFHIVSEVVNTPAPRQYLSAERVKRLVNTEKKRRRAQRALNRPEESIV